MFLLVVPLGASAALMITFEFIAPLLPQAQQWQLPVELSLLGLLWLLNYRGLQLSARLQFGLTLLIIALVLLLLLAAVLVLPVFALAGAWLGFDAAARDVLLQMPVGSKWEVALPPDKAYGADPRTGFPPNVAVVFEIKLVSAK